MTIIQTLAQAVGHHQAGRIQAAEALYRKIMELQPQHPEANHNIGLITVQSGDPKRALPHLKAALNADPSQIQYWLSYIYALVQAGQADTAGQVLASVRQQKTVSAQDIETILARIGALAEELSTIAVSHHLAGRFDEAVSNYRAALALKPTNAGAHSNLGAALYSLGELEAAAASCRRAIEINPDSAQAYCNLGAVLYDHGRLEESLSSYRRAIELAPDLAMAHSNLGNALRDLGQLEESEASCRRAIAIDPNIAEAHCNRGAALHELGRFLESEESCRRAIEIKPDYAAAHCSLGTTLHSLGRLEESAASSRRAIELKPDYAVAYSNLGNTLHGLGRFQEAAASCRRAIEIKPAYAEAHNNLGNSLRSLGRTDEAITHYRQAIHIDSDYAEPYSNLGAILYDLGRLEESEANCRRAIELKPALAMAHCNLGAALYDLGRLDEADASCRRALELRPDLAMAHNNLGNTLSGLGRFDEALTQFEQAIACKPGFVSAFKNLLMTFVYHPSVSQVAIFSAHQRFEDLLARPLYRNILPHRNVPDPGRPLRIGYLSSDLRSHSVARNLLPVVRSHNRSAFEVYFYAEVAQPDSVTANFEALADGWRRIVGLDDQEVAKLIRDDGIDILVCLAGRFDENRPLVCAYKPAPIQISYHDVATSGLTVMDYLFSDRVMTPRNTTERFTERLLCLPTFYLAEIPPDLPPIRPKSGPIVFGCLNNPTKVTDDVLDLWGQLLQSVPDSRLMLRFRSWYEAGSIRERIQAAFDRYGVERSRVTYPAEAGPSIGRLELYNEIDIALDPFPFTGSTTTFEALIMGVPVVTLAGAAMVGRWSAGMLAALNLNELIAATPQDYLAIAQRLAADRDTRNSLRAQLRNRVIRSSLCDYDRKTRQIERFYRAVWRRWCASQNKMNGSALPQ